MNKADIKEYCDNNKPLAYYVGYYGYTIRLYNVVTVNNIDYAIITTGINENYKKYRCLKINYKSSSLHGYIKIDNMKHYMNDFARY